MAYDVHYQGEWRAAFADRDDAMVYVIANGLADDFEITDDSDDISRLCAANVGFGQHVEHQPNHPLRRA